MPSKCHSSSSSRTSCPRSRRSSGRRGGNFTRIDGLKQQPFTACAATFVVAAVAVAVARAATPIAHGWWLVAYLALVGGLSQLLLGPGLTAIADRNGRSGPGAAAAGAQLLLWNVGTVIVAVAVLADAPAGVLVGSVLLLIALGSFAAGLRAAGTAAQGTLRRWTIGYALLLVFLCSSTIVGAALAGALPGQ